MLVLNLKIGVLNIVLITLVKLNDIFYFFYYFYYFKLLPLTFFNFLRFFFRPAKVEEIISISLSTNFGSYEPNF